LIKLLRVDHRLLHGQVAFSWTNAIGANCILIANDDVVKDEVYKTTLKLAKPQGVKLVIKNIKDSIDSVKSGVTDKYNLFIVVSSIEDAYKLSEAIDQIHSVNLGGTRPQDGTRPISKTINIFPYEEEILHKLIDKNIEVEIRQVPTDKKQLVKDII